MDRMLRCFPRHRIGIRRCSSIRWAGLGRRWRRCSSTRAVTKTRSRRTARQRARSRHHRRREHWTRPRSTQSRWKVSSVRESEPTSTVSTTSGTAKANGTWIRVITCHVTCRARWTRALVKPCQDKAPRERQTKSERSTDRTTRMQWSRTRNGTFSECSWWSETRKKTCDEAKRDKLVFWSDSGRMGCSN